MSEQNSDRLEDFFRKAAARPDVSFDENDWKKLEARLDAHEVTARAARTRIARYAAAAVVASTILFSGGLWLNQRYELVKRNPEEMAAAPADNQEPAVPGKGETAKKAETQVSEPQTSEPQAPKQEANVKEQLPVADEDRAVVADNDRVAGVTRHDDNSDNIESSAIQQIQEMDKGSDERISGTTRQYLLEREAGAGSNEPTLPAGVKTVAHDKISGELIAGSAAKTVKIKQKADVDLPGAEGVDGREAIADVSAEHASVQEQRLAAPRLSLLLSLAPDFSGTSMSEYSGPGKAFGAWIMYHIGGRWSISAGALKNNKRYTSSGEYYRPPAGYWIRNTNGIVPSTIDGSCSLIEFPVMVRYTAIDKPTTRWFLSAGASSYLMQAEAYRYTFDQPNPGAKEGWQAHRKSRLMFNMINFSIGVERNILPGFTLGIEPYVKIPLEEIGWPNLKLFSSGASVTMRYTLLRSRSTSRGKSIRPPD